METMDLFAYFNEEALDPDDVSVIGIDNGAGEYAACMARFRYGNVELSNLSIDNNNNKYVFAAYHDQKEVIGEEVLKYGGEIYTNMKVPPESAVKKYGKKLQDAHTYQYLMGKSFYCLIRDLLKNKEIIGDYKGRKVKHIYLFVGRPSSSIWENQAKDYQMLLKEFLPGLEEKPVRLDAQTAVKVKFHVLVYSEAEAAMANEYKLGNIGKNETVMVIDGGSSTFDCAVVKDGKVINEYSRQIGAGMIEQNMLDLFFLEEKDVSIPVDKRKAIHEEAVKKLSDHEGNHILKLRKKKEEFFGPNGKDGEDLGRAAVWYDGRKIVKEMDEKFLRFAIEQMPVRVERSHMEEEDPFGGNRTQDYKSFRDAAEVFFQGAKARCFDRAANTPVAIDRIILTGGATVMPFLQEMIADVFEVEKNGIRLERPAQDRHFSVSRGLAYMGYAELKKREQLAKIRKQVHGQFAAIRVKVSERIQAACMEKIWQQVYIGQIQEWVKDDTRHTLKDWIAMPYHIPVDAVRENVMGLLEEEQVLTDINEALEENFMRLFPKADRRYECRIEQGDIISAFEGNLNQIRIYLDDLLTFKTKACNLLSFLGFRKISWNTALTRAEKIDIQTHITEHKMIILAKLKPQIEEETKEVASYVYQTILRNTDDSLEVYMDGLMPYFVREVSNVKDA